MISIIIIQGAPKFQKLSQLGREQLWANGLDREDLFLFIYFETVLTWVRISLRLVQRWVNRTPPDLLHLTRYNKQIHLAQAHSLPNHWVEVADKVFICVQIFSCSEVLICLTCFNMFLCVQASNNFSNWTQLWTTLPFFFHESFVVIEWEMSAQIKLQTSISTLEIT